jgi:hypothetical protein
MSLDLSRYSSDRRLFTQYNYIQDGVGEVFCMVACKSPILRLRYVLAEYSGTTRLIFGPELYG